MGCLELLFFVQVVLESLPVSSSGHLALLVQLLARGGFDFCAAQLATFDHALSDLLHLPTLIILSAFFLPRYGYLLRSPRRVLPLIMRAMVAVVLADLVTGVIYLICGTWLKAALPLWVGFCVTAIVLFSLRWCPPGRGVRFNAWRALLLGLVQALVLAPGLSRLASTFVVARWLGFRGTRAFEISWAIHVPLIVAVVARDLPSAYADGQLVLLTDPWAILSLSVATVLGYLLLRVTARWAAAGTFWRFGFYMIAPMLLALFLSL